MGEGTDYPIQSNSNRIPHYYLSGVVEVEPVGGGWGTAGEGLGLGGSCRHVQLAVAARRCNRTDHLFGAGEEAERRRTGGWGGGASYASSRHRIS